MKTTTLAILCVLLLMGAIAPATAVTFAEAQAAVAAFYQQSLGRPPDYPGAQGWVDALVSGTLTVDQVRNGIATSPEAQARKPANRNEIGPPIVIIPGLTSQVLFNTGPFVCDNITHQAVSVNLSGRILAIYKILHWHGQDANTLADFNSHLYRMSDEALIAPFPDDHYGPPVGIAGSLVLDFSKAIRLLPGDSLRLDYTCAGATRGQVFIVAWWEWEP